MGTNGQPIDRASVHHELERVRADLHHLLGEASSADLHRRTAGTRWTNQQLLWHMVFGFLIVRRLLPLVRFLARLPDPVSRVFASGLNAATRPFHVVNYLGGVGGALVFHGPRLVWLTDRTLDALHRRLDAESEATLHRAMHFPVDWDPFFQDSMSLEQVYRYGAQHYFFHREQLTLGR